MGYWCWSQFISSSHYLALLAWRQTRFAFGVQEQLSQRMFAVYLYQPYTFHLQRDSTQLIRNAINEVRVFAENSILPGMLLLTESLVLFGLCGLFLVVEPLGALIVVAVLWAPLRGDFITLPADISRAGGGCASTMMVCEFSACNRGWWRKRRETTWKGN